MKRTFDIIISFLGLLILSPIIIFVSLIVKLTSNGPVFYLSDRVGKNEKTFKLVKFRSMKDNSEKKGSLNVGLNDPRVTKIGKFLRSSKIDEIPQLFNVLLGHMSLVGPRPDLRVFTNLYTIQERRILSIKPGMTDWASLVNAFQYKEFNSSHDPDNLFLEKIRPIKVKFQLYYLKNRNFFLDFEIIFWTFLIVVLRVKTLPRKISSLL